MKLYLIRHAITLDHLNGKRQTDQSIIDTSSVDINKFTNLKPDKVYASPYKRTQQTAELLFNSYETLDILHEYIAPDFLTGKSQKYAQNYWHKHIPEIIKNPDWSKGNSESFKQIVERAKKILKFFRSTKFNKIAVVSHRVIMLHILGYLKYKDKYTHEIFDKEFANQEWKNLEMREITI